MLHAPAEANWGRGGRVPSHRYPCDRGGDGGFTMLGMGDLLTQIERKTPVVQLILNNESLDFVNIEQQEAGFIPFGVKFNDPNFAEVAKAMGAKGIRIEEPGDVREGLEEALAYKAGPVVVDAVVDPFALAMPSHSPFHTVKGFTLSMAKQVLAGKMDSVITTIERNVKLIWSSPELAAQVFRRYGRAVGWQTRRTHGSYARRANTPFVPLIGSKHLNGQRSTADSEVRWMNRQRPEGSFRRVAHVRQLL
jgi:Thiamine pyrophosphate enzyme, C-terminal TPP binding domain